MLATEEMPFSQLFAMSVRKILAVYGICIAPVLFLVVVKDWSSYLDILHEARRMWFIINIVTTVLIIYFWSVTLSLCYQVLNDQPVKLQDTFKLVASRMHKVYFSCIIYLLIAIGLYFFARSSAQLMISGGISKEVAFRLNYLGLLALGYFVIFLLTVFTIPMQIVDNAGFLSAFKDSFKLVGLKHFFRSFVIYCIIVVIMVLTSPNSVHGHFLRKYLLSAPFDFIVLSLLIPLLNNYIILLLNDLRIRRAE